MPGLQTWTGPLGVTIDYTEIRSWGRVRVAAGGPSGPTPHRPAAAAAFEAVIGVLYTVILLSRLVGMYGTRTATKPSSQRLLV